MIDYRFMLALDRELILVADLSDIEAVGENPGDPVLRESREAALGLGLQT
ncbi:MAG: hypothetical protein O3A76_12595 [Chloroflexi bacterium]|nr:hypothetical protein [Chloroflexota bacterium]